ncbi:MAG TPA: response regulator [Candidatus Saccharimonadales bacterium]
MADRSILVIEDEANLRGILRDSLASEGYKVYEAKNGEQGLALALSERPDLILLDIVLPGMDGLAVLNEIRKEENWGQNAKVVMLTNLSDSRSVADCLELGAHSFLVKADWTIEGILSMIHDELKDLPSQ